MRVLFTGGGTGGHIYPALALARYLSGHAGAEILFVGTAHGMESEIVPAAGFPLEKIAVVGLQRRLSLQTGRALYLAASSVGAAKRIIKNFRPDVVVGTGGYVAGPVVLAARMSGIPTVIHEQNAIPGLTNVLLSRFATRVCLSFAGSESYFPRPERTVLTGNPRATEAVTASGAEADDVALLPDVPVLLCVGGSHGALKLNEAFSASVKQVLAGCDAQIVYVTGRRYFPEIEEKLQSVAKSYPDRLHLLPYHPALPALMGKTNLMVSRAGATTLAEITALGVPSVLVPSPNVTNNHQEHNARALSDNGAAVLLRESELSEPNLTELLITLLTKKEKLAQMQDACRSLGVVDAAERMSKVIGEIISE
ncbi:undecaprenyldiphospho-muramoylpentapeptide beta-N-acetylglucosaminyltransferase [Dethiobacter alkaliphilus]|uniref:UDP-N-acetylglucosamine--N-acetylmuramyl-(pentapeptide) pyrophosphoryl-undecaprenol N-acetylglucosamine transferase n=1 Tax=Dethiobacter alkaliphilus AHT 1 TaxID=555088 RepID=C0GFT7_DETAL|nr:undecaprenyldiphospho-muramoylpentapeptide beta-N-acetylglucosaminyltransferase [Dethiobacter alkaliphilus]EEG77626.1 UDP-N-acetylglucosamine--N-acetylmuramyl-(pentapeptide) pyrophosphoryl-undecaprenol N-acetylglucosamine transferase [Dethiobacter alkaliphilus AHT 1]